MSKVWLTRCAWVHNKVELYPTVIRAAMPLMSEVRLMLAELMEVDIKSNVT